MTVNAPVVVKLGGELLEDPERLGTVTAALVRVVAGGLPLVVVHGGGKEIDQALKGAGLEKRQVDGLRITDAATLDEVVAVLAGRVNTRLVAALVTAGVPAVGLTGADAGCGRADVAAPHRAIDGRLVDLGLVGSPSEKADTRLLATLLRDGFVPVLACLGLHADGHLLNVNADTFAGDVAARLGAERLVLAGTTPGVLDDRGATVPVLDPAGVDRLIAERTATAGMVAKLRACTHALAHGVTAVVIVDGRDVESLHRAACGEWIATGTRIVGARAAHAEASAPGR